MNKKRALGITAVLITVFSTIFILRFWMTAQALDGQTMQAGAPTQISFQGYLADDSGQPLDGTAALQFDIYESAAGGASLWQETHMNVPVSNGYFAVYLGSVNPLQPSIFNHPTRYLQVSVDTGSGFVAMPRQQFTAVPYALQAENANQVSWSGITNLPPNLNGGEVWSMHGNNDIDPNAHYLGTTNAVSLTLAVSGTTALRLLPAVDGEVVMPNIIGGASSNQILYGSSGVVISGGISNTVSNYFATVSGGRHNTASGTNTTVGGGAHNTASGSDATVGGGKHNTASSVYATIGGGRNNTASGYFATVGGGLYNTASGDHSFTAGRLAHAAHDGAFVWADNQAITYTSSAENQFAIRASGGVTLAVNAGPDKAVQVGERYRDNALIAWGRVGADAVLSHHFGIVEVNQSVTGRYDITLDAVTDGVVGAALIPMAIAEIDSQPIGASGMRIVSINQTGSQTFTVYINNGNFNPVNNDFVFMVTGR